MNRQLVNHRYLHSRHASRMSLAIVSVAVCFLSSGSLRAATVTYVQGADAVPQTSQTSVPVTFTAAQAAGDLNVVVVGWNDTTATVSTVTDKSGNSYTRAVGPTILNGLGSQSIYYARNIVAASAEANIVTVTFSIAAAFPDIRILEYNGVDLNNPVDVTAAGTGSVTTTSSGSVTTTNATDLLFGANLVSDKTTGPGTGFTKRLITAPDGDIAEDEVVSAIGTYSATAPVLSGQWIMQMVAFRTSTAGATGPTITSISPNTGSTGGGTAVAITGTNFASGATVKFGVSAATNVVVVSSTSITATIPAGTAGAVTVTVTVGAQSGSLTGGFTYVATPTVTVVSPNTGSTSGGTAVTITGTNFVAGATVTVGGKAATNVVVASSTAITATTPTGSAGPAPVTVTVSGQSGSLTGGFTYAAIPTVTGVSPNSGSTAGGTTVAIAGANFATGATVTFGGTAATNVVVVSSTSITATTPAKSAGAVAVTVIVSGQSGSLTSGFTYVATPTVTGISPNIGSTAGGTAVTITGTNFVAGATVTFAGTAATNVVVASSTSITATTPTGIAGSATVTVTVSGQSGSLTGGFTYAVIPTVTGVSPNSGSTSGGTTVTITGANFAGGATVTFGGTVATNVVVASSTSVTATTPTGIAGSATVTVTINGQNGSLTNGFDYVNLPTVTGVSPNTGSTVGGTAVTITGTNFVAGATVKFGGTAAINVVVASNTSITATTPAGSAGAATVTVTVSGQSGSLVNGFTYVTPTIITYLQGNSSDPQSPATSVTVAFASAQVAGNLNVVAVGWNDSTARVSAVTDVSGNTYTLAVGPTVQSGVASQSIYYAKNIVAAAAGANSVTVTFSVAATFPDIRILEYSGADPNNPVDVTASSSGSSATSSSGSVTTTSPTDLLFGANLVQTTTSGPGSGFTRRLLTSPDGDIAEDRMVTVTGSYSATAPINSGQWIMQMVAFRTPTGGANGPTVTSISPSGGPAAGGTPVTITGTNFATGAGLTFGGTPATNVVVVSATSITATTPAGSVGAVTVTVTVSGQSGSLMSGFNYVTTPTVSGVSPNTGSTAGGTAITISGANFAPGASVTFGGVVATNVVVVSSTNITAATPAGNVGSVTVTVTNVGVPGGSLPVGFTYATLTPTAPTNLTAVDGGAAPTVAAVQGYYNSTFLTSHTTASFDSRGGDLLVMAASSHSGVTLTPSDSFGNTWTPISGPTNAGTSLGFDLRTQLWYSLNPVVGPNHTVTMSLSASQPLVMSIIVVSGASTSSPIDAVSPIGSDSGTQTTNVISPGINTTAINDLLIGFVKVSSGVTFQPGTGFIQQTAASSNYLDAETGPGATPGTYAAIFTISSPENWQSAVVAAAPSPNQVTLSWTAATETGGTISTYLVERCQGAACMNFAQIGTAMAPTYNDTSVSPSTSYSYRVRARDAANTTGPYASVVTAVTLGPVPSMPDAPGNLTTAGPIVIAGQSYHNATPLTSHTTAAFDSTGGNLIVMSASSIAGVTFTPTDNFGNTWISLAGPTSTTKGANLRTQLWYAQNPVVGPGQTVTIGLSAAEPLTASVLVVSGANPSSPIDIASMIGSDNGTQTANAASPNISTAGLNDLLIGFGQFSTSADILAGSGFTQQAAASSSFLNAETAPVAPPGTYAATFVLGSGQTWQAAAVAISNNPTQATLSWTPSAEIGGNEIVASVRNYLVERCQGTGCTSFAQIGTTTATTFKDTGLTTGVTYNYRVRAEDSTGTTGPYSNVATVAAPGSAPTAPSHLSAAADRNGPVDLTWTASTSGIGIADYIVERCQGATCTNFAQVGTATGTSYIDSAVSSSTTYSYRVQAVDVVGGMSAFSNTATVSTVGSEPPTVPGNLTATAVDTSLINLSWTASTSSLGLANYVLQRCQGTGCNNFAQIATPTGTAWSDTGLIQGASYSYQVEAIDIEGNVSSFSNVATAVTLSATPTITFIQNNYAAPQTAQTSVTVTFTAAQVAGDLNVIAVGWNDGTAKVNAVTDKTGNTYTLAVGPTVISGTASQSIYYAKNIAAAGAGANSITVTFSAAAAFPDIRILEYSGADPNNPVDVTAAASGNSGTSSSGSVTTTNAVDLLFGANLVLTSTTGPGTGFTTRLLTQPDQDIAEDRIVTGTGSYNATAALTPAGQWIMQLVAFRAAAGIPEPLVNLSSANINFGNEQTGVTSSPQPITVTNVGNAQLTLGAIAVSGNNSRDFAQTNTCGTTLTPNATCTINVTFTPTNTGSRSSTVQITDNAPGTPQFASLSGTGTGFAVSPGVIVLTSPQTQQFTASGGSVTWSVDGVVGGSSTSGTISTSGLYIPPAVAGTHTVTATNAVPQSATATVYVTTYTGTFTYHNDNLRTGQNLNETVLTYSNVNQAQFGKLFSYTLDGMAHASPLYVAGVSIPGQGSHNVVYVATENDSVYAFDADGLSTNPLWHVSFLKSGFTTVPCADTGECGDILTRIGITSTPVIDPASGTMYVVAATKEGSSTWVQRLHALDIASGAEKFGGPVVLQGSVPGTGSGSSGGNVPFDALRENQRPALLLSNGVVYLAFGSHGDNLPWHGWVLGYDAKTLVRTMQYNDTANGNGGGIWQGGGGLATDSTGDIYFVTSNGDFDANTGGADYGDSVEKLSTSGAVVDYFTPHDQENMNVNNIDLGAGGPVMLVDQTSGPIPHLLITAGKSGTIYVVNRDNLGHYNANTDNQIVQSLPGALPFGNAESGNFSTPVFFNNYVYFGAINDTIRAFQLTNGQLSSTPASQSATIYEVRGASFAISANGTSNGILWALQNNGSSADTDNTGNPGVLFAYNANDLSTELYDSSQAGTRDTLDLATKFSIPLVANGKVFVAGQTQLTVFGLLP